MMHRGGGAEKRGEYPVSLAIGTYVGAELVFTEFIANPIHCHNKRRLIDIKFDFVTEVTNMDVNGAIRDELTNKNHIKNIPATIGLAW